MNPLILILNKIDINKVLAVTGSALLLVVVAVIVKRKISKNKKNDADEDYLKQISGTVNPANLSYDSAWYESKAISLAADLDASFGNNGGFLGCNQKGVYETMELLKTQDDLKKLETAFGTRELNASWLKKKKPMTLVEAVKTLMTQGEIKKVNKILDKKGIVTPF